MRRLLQRGIHAYIEAWVVRATGLCALITGCVDVV